MGRAKCPKHGLRGIILYCSHLKQAMESDQRTAWTLVGDQHLHYWLCASCVQRFLVDPDHGDVDAFAEHQDITGWCGDCFDEWKNKGMMVVEPLPSR